MPFNQENCLLQLLCHLSKHILVGMPRASGRNAIPTILTADWCSSCLPVDISGQVILFKLETDLVNSHDSTTLPNLYTKRAKTLIDISRDAFHSILNSFSRIYSSALDSKRDLSFFFFCQVLFFSYEHLSMYIPLDEQRIYKRMQKEGVWWEEIMSYNVKKREQ